MSISSQHNLLVKSDLHLSTSSSNIYVVVKVTEACNMGCKYCSAEKDITKAPLLTPEIGKRVIDSLCELGLSSYSVCFHGGEPLLGFAAITKTVEYAMKEYPETKFNFSIQSNLVLMTEETASWCASKNVSVGFSIDGNPSTNDLYRVFQNGRGTTEATLVGLKILQRYQPKVGCVAVIGGHNWNNMNEFINYLATNGVYRLALNRLAPVGKALKLGESAQITDEQYVKSLKDSYLAMIESGYRVQIKPIIDWARKIISPSSCSHGCYQCGAGWSHISIDSTGNVYACDRFSFDPVWVSGNIRDTALIEILNESKMVSCRTRVNRIPECSTCEVVNVCGGSCAVTSYYAKGTIDAPGHECGNMRKFIPWLEKRLASYQNERAAIEALMLGYDLEKVFLSLKPEMELQN
jgi:uncharacterized protein